MPYPPPLQNSTISVSLLSSELDVTHYARGHIAVSNGFLG
jgi:hypothetical protein